MTTDELRDRLARALGWETFVVGRNIRHDVYSDGASVWKHKDDPAKFTVTTRHPVGDTIDALAAVWREELSGWRIQLKQETQSACPGVSWWRGNAFHSDHGFAVPANDPGLGTLAVYAETEYELRLALTLACVEAEKGKQ